MDKTALITGTTGQDGSYLSELLLNKGYNGAAKILLPVRLPNILLC